MIETTTTEPTVTYTYLRTYDNEIADHRCQAPDAKDATKQCSQSNVRYIHVIQQVRGENVIELHVGCVCASRLTGMAYDDLHQAENDVKSKAKREIRDKARFMASWRLSSKGNPTCRWGGYVLAITKAIDIDIGIGVPTAYTLSILYPYDQTWIRGNLRYTSIDEAKEKGWGVVGVDKG